MNSRLLLLRQKSKKTVVGLMSGTSLDGIDCVIARITGSGEKTGIQPIIFRTFPFPPRLKKMLQKCIHSGTVKEITQLNFLLGKIFAESVRKTCRAAKTPLTRIDCIGSHGQTVQHLPHPDRLLGYPIRSTLQIGDPAVIAQETGVLTVGDFRVADMAAGGEGAPLIPYFDHLFFRSRKVNRLLLNIGGIANFTVLPKGGTLEDVIAFDTGPGNMVIDLLMQHLYHRPLDQDGLTAMKGNVLPDLLNKLMNDRFIRRRPPKSTGRENFGDIFVYQILDWKKANSCRNVDLIATVSEFTVKSIWTNYQKFVRRKTKIEEIILSGGGCHNLYLINRLRHYFPFVNFHPIETYGISADEKEALGFAVLANECISEIAANVPTVTGAKQNVILGKICIP